MESQEYIKLHEKVCVQMGYTMAVQAIEEIQSQLTDFEFDREADGVRIAAQILRRKLTDLQKERNEECQHCK